MSTAGVQMACYLDLTFQHAGKVKGDSTTISLGRKDLIECWSFLHEVKAPRDVSTGQATGRRVELPIEITTPVGTASAVLFQALVTNDSLTKGIFNFYKHDRAGKEKLYYKITIEDGTCSQLSTHLPNTKATDLAFHDEYHRVQFTYRKITHENTELGVIGIDDWQQLMV